MPHASAPVKFVNALPSAIKKPIAVKPVEFDLSIVVESTTRLPTSAVKLIWVACKAEEEAIATEVTKIIRFFIELKTT